MLFVMRVHNPLGKGLERRRQPAEVLEAPGKAEEQAVPPLAVEAVVAMVFVVAKAAQPMSGWALEHSL